MEKGVDGAPVAEAEAIPAKEEPRHAHIEMPSITEVGVMWLRIVTELLHHDVYRRSSLIVFDCPCVCEAAASEAGHVVHVLL